MSTWEKRQYSRRSNWIGNSTIWLHLELNGLNLLWMNHDPSTYAKTFLWRCRRRVRGGRPISSYFWIVPRPSLISVVASSSKSCEDRTRWSDWIKCSCCSWLFCVSSAFSKPQLCEKLKSLRTLYMKLLPLHHRQWIPVNNQEELDGPDLSTKKQYQIA